MLLGDLLRLWWLLGTLLVVSGAAMLTLESVGVALRLGPCRVCCRLIEAAIQVLPILGSLRLRAMKTAVLVHLSLVRRAQRCAKEVLVARILRLLVKVTDVAHIAIALRHVIRSIGLVDAF